MLLVHIVDYQLFLWIRICFSTIFWKINVIVDSPRFEPKTSRMEWTMKIDGECLFEWIRSYRNIKNGRGLIDAWPWDKDNPKHIIMAYSSCSNWGLWFDFLNSLGRKGSYIWRVGPKFVALPTIVIFLENVWLRNKKFWFSNKIILLK